MHLNVEHDSMGVLERSFELEVAGARVPGLLWSPADATGPRPLVLMGHGGSQHKRVDTLLARARRFVRRLGFAVAAIDAPDHGDRATAEERARRVQGLQDRIAGRRPPDDSARQEGARRADRACPEWTAALDALQTVDVIGTGRPVGYWGVSMGTAIGVPFVAGEPRIRAAVLGLNGAVPGPNSLAEPAKRITIPVEFVLQADDELVALDHGIALYDALASMEKSLHINPGGHLDTPAFEADSWMAFFARHLG
jgi:pimeloyl-ACP methyl ester carboxylesterase